MRWNQLAEEASSAAAGPVVQQDSVDTSETQLLSVLEDSGHVYESMESKTWHFMSQFPS